MEEWPTIRPSDEESLSPTALIPCYRAALRRFTKAEHKNPDLGDDFRNVPVLTLVACYPFYYIGNAPQRYIVRASLLDEKPDRKTSAQAG